MGCIGLALDPHGFAVIGFGFSFAFTIFKQRANVVDSSDVVTYPDDICTVPQPEADLAVTKSGEYIGISLNEEHEFRWVITVTNNGPDDATNVQLVDSLGISPASLTHVIRDAQPSQGDCPPPSFEPDISCNLGTLAKGGTASVILFSEVFGTAAGSVIGTNNVEVAAAEPDHNLANNVATASAVFGEIPDRNGPDTQEPSQDPATTVALDVSHDGGLLVGELKVNPWDMGAPADIERIISGETADEYYERMMEEYEWEKKFAEEEGERARQSEQIRREYEEFERARLYAQDASDPIYLHSGEYFLYEVDLRIPGRGFDWAFARKYRSGVTFNGPLGYNWDFNYNRRLVLVTAQSVGLINTGGFPTVPTSGDVIRMDGLGRVDLYQQQTDGSYRAPDGFYTDLERLADGSFAERDFRGQTVFYSQPDESGLSRLTALQDRNGNTMRFNHNAQGQLVEVLDTLGRAIQYTYTGDGHLISITDFLGRSIEFTYDINGDLVEVTSPTVTGTPNGNDFPQGKTVRYSYSSGFDDIRLNHNLQSITAPNEVASGGQPRVVITYDTDTTSPNVDRVLSLTFGGTSEGEVPAGGTNTYQYQSLAAPDPPRVNDPVRQTTVTDRNGNVTEYHFNRLGNTLGIREFTNRNVRPSDLPFFETLYEYNADSELTRVIYPEGNSVEYVYDDANPDRFQQGNLLAEMQVPDPDRGGDQPEIVTGYTYEPIYNQLESVTEARGNDPSYVPQNGGTNSPDRYTTVYIFDYQESCDFQAIADRTGSTSGDVQQLLADAAMCITPLGDVGGDGRTDQVNGNLIRVQHPIVNLLPGSNQEVVEGETTQFIMELYSYNEVGQLVRKVDPEGNVDLYEYHPENDPDGDGLDLTAGVGTGAFGYLSQVTRDAVGPALQLPTDLNDHGEVDSEELRIVVTNFNSTNGVADVNGDFKVDIIDLALVAIDFGRTHQSASIRTEHFYNRAGIAIRQVDGRGIATAYVVNELNQPRFPT